MVSEKKISELEFCQELFKQWKNKKKDEDSFDLGLTLGIKIAQRVVYDECEDKELRKEFRKLFGIDENENMLSDLEKIYNLETKQTVKRLTNN